MRVDQEEDRQQQEDSQDHSNDARVLPLSVVDNSVFSPIRLTVTLDPPYPSL
jgi:hypothetical protein